MRELDHYEAVAIGPGSVTAVPFMGEHADLAVRGKTGYAVTVDGRTALCVAD